MFGWVRFFGRNASHLLWGNERVPLHPIEWTQSSAGVRFTGAMVLFYRAASVNFGMRGNVCLRYCLTFYGNGYRVLVRLL
jgi:hypothetical protein